MRSSQAILAAACFPLSVKSQPISPFDHSDGVSPYGDGFAPDVVSVDFGNELYASNIGDIDPDLNNFDNATFSSGQVLGLDRRAAQDFYLRIMPLGASITQGQESSDGNGYRKWLRSQLRWKGWNVNMVGSKHDGTMADDDNEGHPGWTIGSVHGAFTESKSMMPNLVLVNAGLNDCNNNAEDGAAERLKDMTDDIFNSIPGVTVILSTLLPNRDQNPCTDRISQQIRQLVESYRGSRIGLADIRPHLSLGDLVDGTHPNDQGYKVFAAVWWDAISKLEDRIQPPAAVPGVDDRATSSNKCKKVAGNSGPPVQSQLGSGHDDGGYVHSSIAHGALASARIDKGKDPKSLTDAYPWHVFFANLVVGDPNADRKAALDDWVRIWHDTNDKNTYYFRQNLGGGKFGDSVKFDVDMDCDLGPRYAFADLNNDGLDDFFCLKGSSVWVSLNRGGNPPKFESIGQVVGNLDGYAASDVRIADIDGDGRADFCLLQTDGTVICSRNGGQGDSPQWQGFNNPAGVRGTVFTQNKADKSGIVLADLNGDFRSDYMYINDFGNVHTWINQRGVGSGIIPSWKSAGLTHEGQQESGIQERIKFGRIFGSGRRDYIFLKEQDDHYDVVVWENTGSGGTKLKADGNFYCDMLNRGADDYVWIYQDGQIAEINVNLRSPPLWGHDLDISLTVPGPRVGIHLADWNGDGKCDVLVQNKATGALTLYQNNYSPGADTITFGGPVSVTSATCKQGWGVGIFDRGMRLADIDGDGRADVLCIEEDGRITAWLNLANGMIDVGQVKFSEGWDRANMRLADVEASGRADLLHVDKYTGAVTVFKNNGRTSSGNSSFSWTNRGKLYNPINRGETMIFTNQGGLYRADMVHVDPVTNKAWTYFNKCGNSGGDDGTISDPGLPVTGGGSVPGDGGDNGDYPIILVGFCEGPDCINGHCVGPLCVSGGCSGSGCSGGKCSIPSLCIPLGCIGPGCTDGICVGAGCKTKGCVGPDCDSGTNRCKEDRCISTGCGGDCDGEGKCRGPACNRHSCTGRDCVDGVCVGPNCSNQLEDLGGACGGSGCVSPGDPPASCTQTATVSTCITTTESTVFFPIVTTWSTWSSSECRTNIGCSVTDSSSQTTITATAPPRDDDVIIDYDETPTAFPIDTSRYNSVFSPTITSPPAPTNTNFIDCRHQNESPGEGINDAYCVCSGSTFSESVATYVTPYNSCGYTTKPSATIPGPSGLPQTTNTAECKVCSVVGQNNNACTSMADCTPVVTPTPTPTPKRRCVTAHTYVYVNAYFGGTVLHHQVWENGDLVCSGTEDKHFPSDDTNWDYNCDGGGKLRVNDNGRNLEYTSGDGWFSVVPRTDGARDQEDCGSFAGPSGTDHTIWCIIWEYAFSTDGCDNCPIAEVCGEGDCGMDGTCAD